MNNARIKAWLARQQIATTLLLAAAFIVIVLYIVLSPLNRQRRKIEDRITTMRSNLMVNNNLLGEDILQEKKSAEESRMRSLRTQWDKTVARAAAFRKSDESLSVGHIDFRVALFDVTQSLFRKAREANINLPRNLGLDNTVKSDEDARKLMLQLRTVEKLVDLALDLNIGTLRAIMPLPPVMHGPDANNGFMEEYPVQIEMSGRLATVYDFLDRTLQPGSVFALKNVRIEASQGSRETLDVNAVVSALMFLKSPDELPLLTKPGSRRRSAPMGH